ncbi:Na+/H+ antiporter subunit G [Rhodoplanes sp. TEM]|uniref:Na+/H+ antiporter subunit G n=1 Tax=Rhodoplanes tepidamans TaxID=200616 RepID=A0ABT5JJ63_RHOTP|nr:MULTISPECIES: Na+/H+ antiporter subunit G [Rhodoplanes]MDC7789533.1 Na+/H+ antiporter subunit G [Rhodoplanes tepidamans]MDC7987729.1 Na+/H+ antiporter subunit G [Rhodoplanes sp. TEM]MDQ0354003.1 multicomponent K+:H+ antiporter subunit G [Rhodoplanes tepidamans]
MALASEILVTVLILVGTFFLFVGSLGLAKLPDLMRRLHAPTKATTLGIGALLIASMLWFDLVHDALSFHEVLIALFLFMTAPVSAHVIAKAHILRDAPTRATLPPAQTSGWATLEPHPADPRER